MHLPLLQERHLRAITALSSEGIAAPEVRLTDDNGQKREVCYLSSADGAQSSAHVVARQLFQDVEAGTELQSVRLFASRDGRLALNLFEVTRGGDEPRFGSGGTEGEVEAEAEAVKRLNEYAAKLKAGAFIGKPLHALPSGHLLLDETLNGFLARCTSRYVTMQLPRLLYRQMDLYERVAGGDGAALDIEHGYASEHPQNTRDAPGHIESATDQSLITLAIPGVPARQALWRALSVLRLYPVDLLRAQIDVIHGPTPESEDVTMLRTVIRPDSSPTAGSLDWSSLSRDLEKLKWVEEKALGLALHSGGALTLQEAEVAGCLATLSLSVLDHPLLSSSNVHERLGHEEALPHAAALARCVRPVCLACALAVCALTRARVGLRAGCFTGGSTRQTRWRTVPSTVS